MLTPTELQDVSHEVQATVRVLVFQPKALTFKASTLNPKPLNPKGLKPLSLNVNLTYGLNPEPEAP